MKQEVKSKPINTRRLQIFELNRFMIDEYGAVFDGVAFTAISAGSIQQYSFHQAVQLFNEYENKSVLGLICKDVKLHYCKKKKKILARSHLVHFDESFKEMLVEDVDYEEMLKATLNVARLR